MFHRIDPKTGKPILNESGIKKVSVQIPNVVPIEKPIEQSNSVEQPEPNVIAEDEIIEPIKTVEEEKKQKTEPAKPLKTQSFAGMKKLNFAKKKLQRENRFKKALIALRIVLAMAVTAAGAAVGINAYINHSFSSTPSITHVIDKQIDDVEEYIDAKDIEFKSDIPMGECEVEFSGDIVGYIYDDNGVFAQAYPIAQGSSENPNFYLDHGVDGEWNPIGVPYIDANCNLDHEGDFTIIYGHHCYGNQVFGGLTDAGDTPYYIEDQYGVWKLTPCASGVYNGKEMLTNLLYGDEQEALDYIKAGSTLETDNQFDPSHRKVVLMTCQYSDVAPGEERHFTVLDEEEVLMYKPTPSQLQAQQGRTM